MISGGSLNRWLEEEADELNEEEAAEDEEEEDEAEAPLGGNWRPIDEMTKTKDTIKIGSNRKEQKENKQALEKCKEEKKKAINSRGG